MPDDFGWWVCAAFGSGLTVGVIVTNAWWAYRMLKFFNLLGRVG